MTAQEIQKKILEVAGLKTSVKKGRGSMKGYLIIMPIFQNGQYPPIPFDLVQELKVLLSDFDNDIKPVFCSTSDISVFGLEDDRVYHKKEAKPKEKSQMKSREWGSKNSQIRLNKAAARYAKKLQKGGCARYN